MKNSDEVSELLNNCIRETSVPGRAVSYRGKVRDIYHLTDNIMAIVVTDRVSAFDHVFAEPIPFKGQLLNRMAWYGFRQIESICKHHIIEVPHPNVTIAQKCRSLPVEVVIRGYLSGHAWRVYQGGSRELCGQKLPDGLVQHQAFEQPIITPTTKAQYGHDEDISEAEIIQRELVPRELWEQVRETAFLLFQQGSMVARKQGLLLVDTKYEFGLYQNELVLIDEVHTTDSSRYFYADGYEERIHKGAPQKQLSKEFLREWLIKKGFVGKLDKNLPSLPDELRISVYQRYRELYETLTGETFEPVSVSGFNEWLGDLLYSLQR
ncbi:MAG: phosphoribosylaminoimidazolesuccinocarboxamide synthase [Balneolales bacterium]